MKNKYQIGELVEVNTDQGVKVGRVYEIKAMTKRFCATKVKDGYSVIVEGVSIGYRILGYTNKVRECDIIRCLEK